MDIDVVVQHNGDDITASVISYDIEKKICTGAGSLEITLLTGDTFIPYDIIEIWEEGDKKGKFFVSKILDDVTGTTTLSCLDNVKRLQDYFIIDTYLIDYPSLTRYWIEKFLDEAGVEYTFTTESTGSLLSNNTSLGLSQAYDQILTLLQMSGWYMYFDDDGIAIIGELETDISDIVESYSKTDILDIQVNQNDDMLRNRVVVWGNQDPVTEQWVFAEIHHPTPWDIDENDIRTILISNSNIPDVANAYALAAKGINEFARITTEKRLTVHGSIVADLGDYVFVESDVYVGSGLVTSVGSTMSKDGLVSSLTLDERCPRLFGFFNYGDYVYVGTRGSGVWRKHVKYLNNWTNFSTGLTDLNITDLIINSGTFICTTETGKAFIRNPMTSAWVEVLVTGFANEYKPDVTFSRADVKAVACTINKDLNTSYLLFTSKKTDESDSLIPSSWVVKINPLTRIGNTPVLVDINDFDEQEFIGVDLDTNGKDILITVLYPTRQGAKIVRNAVGSGRYLKAVNEPLTYNSITSPISSFITKTLWSGDATPGLQVFVYKKKIYFTVGAGGNTYMHRYNLETDVDTVITIPSVVVSYSCLASEDMMYTIENRTIAYNDKHLIVWRINFVGEIATEVADYEYPLTDEEGELYALGFNNICYYSNGYILMYFIAGINGAPFEVLIKRKIVTLVYSTIFDSITDTVHDLPYIAESLTLSWRSNTAPCVFSGRLIAVFELSSPEPDPNWHSFEVTLESNGSTTVGNYHSTNPSWVHDTVPNYTLGIVSYSYTSYLQASKYTVRDLGTIQKYSGTLDDRDDSWWKFEGDYITNETLSGSINVGYSAKNGRYLYLYDNKFIAIRQGAAYITDLICAYSEFDTPGLVIKTSTILDNFELVKDATAILRVECSQELPFVVFATELPLSLIDVVPSGINEADIMGACYISDFGDIDTFMSMEALFLASGDYIFDCRVFSLSGMKNILYTGKDHDRVGDQTMHYFQSPIFGSEDEVVINAITIATEGELERPETSNYSTIPAEYKFVSTSGAPSEFFQKNPDTNNFVEYSTDLPSSNITVVRIDDRV